MTRNDLTTQLRRVARERFGYDRLYPHQEAVVASLMGGSDVLAVFPTGSGKSAIYQTAGVLIPGGTLVVSPLIALQKDQVAHIEGGRDLPEAAVLNSHTPASRRREIFEAWALGTLEYVFVAPEQLVNAETLGAFAAHPPSLVAVDEAHCVSEWGHDFRPEFAAVGKVLATFEKRPRLLALTATATQATRDDLVRRLGLVDVRVHADDLDRPEIGLAVEEVPDRGTKDRLLPNRLRDVADGADVADGGCGIVYVATRANAEEVAMLLRENNIEAGFYHGGLARDERERAQDAFMGGVTPVMVATNAFGMGVDKPDVRVVVHYDVPDSLDAYYQEVGRAGRDGAASRAVLFFREADLGRRRAMSSPVRLDADEVADVLETILYDGTSIDAGTLGEETDQTGGRVRRTVDLLESLGAVRREIGGEVFPLCDPSDVAELAAGVVAEQERFRDWRRARVDAMGAYATTRRCRRAVLLDYFGQTFDPPCGNCDCCLSSRDTSESPRDVRDAGDVPFPAGATVQHVKLGRGIVQSLDGPNVAVLFESAGVKTLRVKFTLGKRLMERIG